MILLCRRYGAMWVIEISNKFYHGECIVALRRSALFPRISHVLRDLEVSRQCSFLVKLKLPDHEVQMKLLFKIYTADSFAKLLRNKQRFSRELINLNISNDSMRAFSYSRS